MAIDRVPSEKPLRHGDATGVQWRELPSEILPAIAKWEESGTLSGDRVLKPDRVVQCGDAVLKLFPRRPSLLSPLRIDPALREARLAFSIDPIRAPLPWATLRADHTSLLVSEFVKGRDLNEAWSNSETAREALPIFLADMHRAGVLHGDPHFRNMLWTGEEWVLLDLASLRRGAHRLLRRSLMTRQWARLIYDVTYFHADATEELSRLYAVYRDRADGGWVPAWDVVLRVAVSYSRG